MRQNNTFFLRLLAALLSAPLVSCGSDVNFDLMAPPPPGMCPTFTGFATGPFTLSGTALYEDKTYTATGFTGGVVTLPIRFATVEAVRCSDSTVLSTTATDINGNFVLTGNNTTWPGIQVRVLAQATVTGQGPVTVQDLMGNGHAVATASVDERSTFAVGLTATTLAGGGAFNLLDVATRGIEYIVANLPLAAPLPPLTVTWQSGTGMGASYFQVSFGQPSINVNSTLADPDEYDDTVVMHEMGHFAAYALSADDSPGGIHYLLEPDQDARLAWSEGWGGFFSGVALGNSIYVDTDGAGGFFGYDLETVQSDPLFWSAGGGPTFSAPGGSVSENDIAATLWDLVDVPADGGDATSALDVSVLAAFTGLRTLPTTITYDEFWKNISPGLGVNLAAAQSTSTWNGIDTAWDGGADDVPAGAVPVTVGTTAAPVAPVSANLAPDPATGATDVDYYSVTLLDSVPYTILTTYVSNGADTEIVLRDPLNAIAASDDNAGASYSTCTGYSGTCPRNGASFSSALAFTPAVGKGGVYTVEVHRPVTGSPPYTGGFGRYTLAVTAP